MPDFEVGERIGDYEVLGVLGAGGMGKVYRVRHVISERVEAMKVLLPGLLAEPGLLERFLREIKIQASLDHANIAALHTAMHHGDSYLMIMEFVDGEPLDRLISQQPLELAKAIDIIIQALSGLSYAHERGVVHRDIKPSNLLVSPTGQVKVTDFGVARLSRDKGLTATGSVIGSLYYMAPEQLQGGIADARSDLYSTGATLYEIVTGHRPHDGANEYQVMKGHLELSPTVPEELNPQVSPELSAVILKSLEKLPSHRYQNAREFQTALAPFRTVKGSTRTRVPPTTTTPSGVTGEELARIQSKLAHIIGPIAATLVTQSARRHRERQEIVSELAGYIEHATDRDAFLRSCSGHATPAPKTSVDETRTLVAAPQWDPELLRSLKQNLTRYLGPIAGVVVDRKAKKATTAQALYKALAAEIPDDQDRASFMRSLPHS